MESDYSRYPVFRSRLVASIAEVKNASGGTRARRRLSEKSRESHRVVSMGSANIIAAAAQLLCYNHVFRFSSSDPVLLFPPPINAEAYTFKDP